MARLPLEDAVDLTAGEVVHERFSTLPATASVGDVRAWFEESAHRNTAFLAENGRYVGSLTRDDLTGDIDADRSAAELSHEGPVIAPDASAKAGHELALTTESLRVPVVGDGGELVGVLAVTADHAAFCGAG
jgi:CBS domain-containing protein